MKRAYPKTYKYLKQFETQLCKRASSSVRKLMESGPFYSMFAVGPYTIAPWKVLWPEVGHSIESAKCGPSHLNRGSKSSLPDHTVVAVSCDNEAEASYLSAILNSLAAQAVTRGYIVLHPSPHVLGHVQIPKYNRRIPEHNRLAELGKACHDAVQRDQVDGLHALESEVDSLAASLWGVSVRELAAIRDCACGGTQIGATQPTQERLRGTGGRRVKTETLSVMPLPDYETRAVRIANEILRERNASTWRGPPSPCGTSWNCSRGCERSPKSAGSSASCFGPIPRGPLPTPLPACWRSTASRLPSPTRAPRFGTTDFLISDGKVLTVLATSLHLLYPESFTEAEGSGMVQHPLPADALAREVMARFERCWSEAHPVNEELLIAFRRQSEACTTRFVEGNLVRSTNELYTGYGIGFIQKAAKCPGQGGVQSLGLHAPALPLREQDSTSSPRSRRWRRPWIGRWRGTGTSLGGLS